MKATSKSKPTPGIGLDELPDLMNGLAADAYDCMHYANAVRTLIEKSKAFDSDHDVQAANLLGHELSDRIEQLADRMFDLSDVARRNKTEAANG